MNLNDLAVIVMAAGRGKRFGEEYTKLLHPILGKPLIYYPIQNLKSLNVSNIFIVVSNPEVESEIRKNLDCEFVYQPELNGTAKAVEAVIPRLSSNIKTILVLNGDDATLYSKSAFEDFLRSHEVNKADISMMTLKTNRKMEVGRVIRDKKKNFSKILEYKEYLEAGIRSNEINCGVYLINLDFAKNQIPNISKNPNGEYYLTDLLNIAKEQSKRVNLYVLKDHSQWIGINDKKDLKYALNVIKKRGFKEEQKPRPLKSVHFLGIAGSGTSACAVLARESGFQVSGCDKNLSGEFTEVLEKISTEEGHNPSHLDGVDILAVTPAVLSLDPNNPELIAARRRKIKVMTWQQFLGRYLTEGKFVIAICGTHGKSTTTAMIGKILEDAGLDPTVLLGATTSFWKANFRIGSSKYFVVEADEFNENFMSLEPKISILTNLEFDHPEYFKDFNSYVRTFQNFLHTTQDLIIANLSDPKVSETLEEKPGTEETFFAPVIDYSKNIIDFPLKISGKQNIMNASAAFNLGLNIGISNEKIKQSLQNFPGIGRRMEFIGEINGAKIFSDFAHHPTAIKVATEQIKNEFPDKKIWIIYQPHMFSRTKALFNEFVEVFKSLDVSGISIIDIYPSREKDTGLIHARDLVEAINKPNIKYNDNLEETIQQMKNNVDKNVVAVFMGAGDIDGRARKLIHEL